MVLEKVIEILADQLSVDPAIINEDSNLVDDLGADSLAVIDLIMCIEDENLKTVGAIVQFIEDHQ